MVQKENGKSGRFFAVRRLAASEPTDTLDATMDTQRKRRWRGMSILRACAVVLSLIVAACQRTPDPAAGATTGGVTLHRGLGAEPETLDPLLASDNAARAVTSELFEGLTTQDAGGRILLWILFGAAIVRTSRRQDADGDLSHTRRNVRLSVAFIVVFAVTLWLAGFDWLMSLEPHWYSTLFGVYNFAGLFLSGQAAGIIILVWLQRAGYLRGSVTENHLHDLGKLLFAFSTFWAYIWFSQYMLIWYANIPEETAHFVRQLRGVWGLLFILNLMLNWVIPFFILLPRATKRSP